MTDVIKVMINVKIDTFDIQILTYVIKCQKCVKFDRCQIYYVNRKIQYVKKRTDLTFNCHNLMITVIKRQNIAKFLTLTISRAHDMFLSQLIIINNAVMPESRRNSEWM